MKLSSVLHGVASVTGVLGALALSVAWVAGENGTALGFSEQHLFSDAIVFLLISIASGIGTLVHLQLERQG